jgi:hypothetical protein
MCREVAQGMQVKNAMSFGPINPLSSSYIQSALTSAIQGSGLTTNTTGNNAGGIDALAPVAQRSDDSRLSPFAQLMTTLQQLQQSDPSKYQQVTQQIATNLQSAAQTAQSDGNTTAAAQLNQLSADFTSASKSGQLPSIQDLAKAVGGHHHHHHHAATDSATASDADSSSGSASSSSPSTSLSQLLAAFQSNGTQGDPLNPMNIILGTLSSAGISTSGS